MKKELRDKAWACLPKEVREEIMRLYYMSPYNELRLLNNIFDDDNILSKPEPEEILMIKRSRAVELYEKASNLFDFAVKDHDEIKMKFSLGIKYALMTLFDYKCLPDEEETEPKFEVGKLARINGRTCKVLDYNANHEFPYLIYILSTGYKTIVLESDLEPYPKETR